MTTRRHFLLAGVLMTLFACMALLGHEPPAAQEGTRVPPAAPFAPGTPRVPPAARPARTPDPAGGGFGRAWARPDRRLYGLVGQGSLSEPLDPALLAVQYRAGVRGRLLELGWDRLQPAGPNDWDAAAAGQFQARIDAFLATGPDTVLVLDLGLQYAPAWAAALDPLVDQYGHVWQARDQGGGVNVYWSPRVRTAVARYIRRVFASLDFHGRLWAVRVGPYGGELLYPAQANAVGGCDPAQQACPESFWAYDATAQAHAPLPGWRPQDTPADPARARTFYYWYVGNLVNTFDFLLAAIRDAYHGPPPPTLPLSRPAPGCGPGRSSAWLATTYTTRRRPTTGPATTGRPSSATSRRPRPASSTGAPVWASRSTARTTTARSGGSGARRGNKPTWRS